MARFFYMFFIIALGKSNEKQPMGNFKLEQVLILSRHNIRTPLVQNLQVYSPKTWTKFNEPVGHLTQRGALLESYMGKYISEWLESNDFIKGCPKPEEVLIYANTLARTRDTAKSFANAVFPSCNIPLYHNEDLNSFDPMFLPIYHNKSEYFTYQVIKEMKKKLQNVDLKQSYLELNEILDIQNSEICKKYSICDISELKDEVALIEGEIPRTNGPLSISTDIVDYFIMSYYDGFPLDDVAWGQITTDRQWKLLAKILKQNQDVKFNLTCGAKDMAGPLLNNIFHIFTSGTPKFTVLFAHDCNLSLITSALGFKEFMIRNQHEPFPIGGKLVFQKWSNKKYSYLKVEYMYQTFLQLRNGVILSLAEPPEKKIMELKDCKIDDNGLCRWDDFIKMNFGD